MAHIQVGAGTVTALARQAAIVLIWTGCSTPPPSQTAGILAPRSLRPVLEPVVAAWEAAHGTRVHIGFDTPERLLRQANGGTHADVFVSADARWMNALVSDGHVDESLRRPVAYDPLVFVGSAGNPPPRDPRELVTRVQGQIGISSPDSPNGALARLALVETKVWDRLTDRVVEVRSPDDLRERLESGDLQAAVTVQSVVLAAHDTLSSHPFSPELDFGSTIEVAPLNHDLAADPILVHALISSIIDGPDARAGWKRAGLDAFRSLDPVGVVVPQPPTDPPSTGPMERPALPPQPRPLVPQDQTVQPAPSPPSKPLRPTLGQ